MLDDESTGSEREAAREVASMAKSLGRNLRLAALFGRRYGCFELVAIVGVIAAFIQLRVATEASREGTQVQAWQILASSSTSRTAPRFAIQVLGTAGQPMNGLFLPNDAWLNDLDIPGVELRNLQAPGANLSGSNLRGADLRGAQLHGANLSGCDLRDVDLRGAACRGASFRNSDLRGAKLGQITSANVEGADLRGTGITRLAIAEMLLTHDNQTRFDNLPNWGGEVGDITNPAPDELLKDTRP
ncbi:MAG: pentapeptide repeat-containing protein [Candidatus Eisenbacteria bacterium]